MTQRNLKRFGQYLHALQDSYSHQTGECDREPGKEYSPEPGHVFAFSWPGSGRPWGHWPDRPEFRWELHLKMRADTLQQLKAFNQYLKTAGK